MQPSLPELTFVIVYFMGSLINILKNYKSFQNSAACIVKQIRKTYHITPILAELHWLPVTFRIKYKLLLFAFEVCHDTAPQYLSELLHPYVPRRNLCSSDVFLLETPHSHLVSCGDRSFSVSAPRLWNDLPYYLRSCDSLPHFEKLLETLFLENILVILLFNDRSSSHMFIPITLIFILYDFYCTVLVFLFSIYKYLECFNYYLICSLSI